MATPEVTQYVPYSHETGHVYAWEVQDRDRSWPFDTLDDLASSLKKAWCALSLPAARAVARHMGVKTSVVLARLEAAGVGRPLKATDLVGLVDFNGNRVLSLIRRARDSRGSCGTVYQVVAPDGTQFTEFVHSCQLNSAVYRQVER